MSLGKTACGTRTKGAVGQRRRPRDTGTGRRAARFLFTSPVLPSALRSVASLHKAELAGVDFRKASLWRPKAAAHYAATVLKLWAAGVYASKIHPRATADLKFQVLTLRLATANRTLGFAQRLWLTQRQKFGVIPVANVSGASLTPPGRTATLADLAGVFQFARTG